MPILPAEPDMYPATLWDHDGPASDPDRQWWCLHTKPRQDKLVARILRKRRIAYYFPQVEQVSRTPGGRKLRSILPLFGGYVFLHGDMYERAEALHGSHVANVLEVTDQATLQLELFQVHQMLSSGLPITPEPTHVVGTIVQVVVGPLKGIVGTVVRRGKRDAFVAHVQFLRRGVMVELQDWQVEPVPHASIGCEQRGSHVIRGPPARPMMKVGSAMVLAILVRIYLYERTRIFSFKEFGGRPRPGRDPLGGGEGTFQVGRRGASVPAPSVVPRWMVQWVGQRPRPTAGGGSRHDPCPDLCGGLLAGLSGPV